MSLEEQLNYYIPHIADTLNSYSISAIAKQIGCPEGALKLICSLLIAYPLGTFYQAALINSPKHVKHLYFALTGFTIGVLNYGK